MHLYHESEDPTLVHASVALIGGSLPPSTGYTMNDKLDPSEHC